MHQTQLSFCHFVDTLFSFLVWVDAGTLGAHDEPNQKPYRQFMVCRPEVKKSELHPDEGNVNKITTDYFYGTLLNEKGQIEDDLLLRKCVFFGGLEKSLRKMVWPFLLHCYSFNSTFEDRAVLMDIRNQVRIAQYIHIHIHKSYRFVCLPLGEGVRRAVETSIVFNVTGRASAFLAHRAIHHREGCGAHRSW